MGRKPVFGLAGLLLATLSQTGCDDCMCPWRDKSPNKSVTYTSPGPTGSAVKPTSQAPYGSPTGAATTGFSDRQPTTSTTTGNGAGYQPAANAVPANNNSVPYPSNPMPESGNVAPEANATRDNGLNDFATPKKAVSNNPVPDPVMESSRESPSFGDPKKPSLPNNDIPNEPRLIDATPSAKTTTIDRSKVASDPLPPLDEPPPPIQTSNKSPGLGGPTADDLPPVPDVPEPGAPPAPLRSKYQSNHQSIPTPPSGSDLPPVIPAKSAGDSEKDK